MTGENQVCVLVYVWPSSYYKSKFILIFCLSRMYPDYFGGKSGQQKTKQNQIFTDKIWTTFGGGFNVIQIWFPQICLNLDALAAHIRFQCIICIILATLVGWLDGHDLTWDGFMDCQASTARSEMDKSPICHWRSQALLTCLFVFLLLSCGWMHVCIRLN